uniref:Uncharacterized protein n=1 Tax=Anguilla anguilla TaxID=7936 RepID=A0A0E9RFY3_ANGAN
MNSKNTHYGINDQKES